MDRNDILEEIQRCICDQSLPIEVREKFEIIAKYMKIGIDNSKGDKHE